MSAVPIKTYIQPKTSIRHATFTYDDERNAARTVHGIGFQAVCECGETFRVRASYRMASADIREHVKIHRS